MDAKVIDLPQAQCSADDIDTPCEAGRPRIDTRSLPSSQLRQILALDGIPSVNVSKILVREARLALDERKCQSNEPSRVVPLVRQA